MVLVPVRQDLQEMQETHKCLGVLVQHEVPTDGLLKSLHSEVRRWEVGEALTQVHDIILFGQSDKLHPGNKQRVSPRAAAWECFCLSAGQGEHA